MRPCRLFESATRASSGILPETRALSASPPFDISQKGDSDHTYGPWLWSRCMHAHTRGSPKLPECSLGDLGRWPRACTSTPHGKYGTRHLRQAYGCCAPRAFPSRRLPCWATLASPSALTHPTGCVVCTIKACTHPPHFECRPRSREAREVLHGVLRPMQLVSASARASWPGCELGWWASSDISISMHMQGHSK